MLDFNGGGKRDRTADLLHAMQALSQLSYTPYITRQTAFKRVDVQRRRNDKDRYDCCQLVLLKNAGFLV
jgi:hypothetical protein